VSNNSFSTHAVGIETNKHSLFTSQTSYHWLKLVKENRTVLCLLVYGMNLTMLRIFIMVVAGYGVTEYKTKLDEWVTK